MPDHLDCSITRYNGGTRYKVESFLTALPTRPINVRWTLTRAEAEAHIRDWGMDIPNELQEAVG